MFTLDEIISPYRMIDRKRILLTALAIVLLGGSVFIIGNSLYERLFGNKGEVYEFQPFDPESQFAIGEKISRLNKEGVELEGERALLSEYVEHLNSSSQILQGINAERFDTVDIPSKLIKIQPNYILQLPVTSLSSTSTDAVPGKLSFEKWQLARGREYSVLYGELANKLGFDITYKAYNQSWLNSELYISDFRRKEDSRVNQSDVQLRSIKQDSATFAQAVLNLNNMLSKQIDDAKNKVDSLKNRIPKLNEQIKDLRSDYLNSKVDINKYAVLVGIPLFIISALLMYFYGIYNSNKLREDLKIQDNSFNSQDYKTGLSFTLFSITVLLLILTLMILGLAGVLGEDVLAALLGTVAGYVLNTAVDKSGAQPSNGNGNNTQPAATLPSPPNPQPIPTEQG
ncbi:MAG: hypothetical protein SFW35_11445 [Chitinophagales bacterium]|nr:hypothetical protein [Chitinophagales bacterium]